MSFQASSVPLNINPSLSIALSANLSLFDPHVNALLYIRRLILAPVLTSWTRPFVSFPFVDAYPSTTPPGRATPPSSLILAFCHTGILNTTDGKRAAVRPDSQSMW